MQKWIALIVLCLPWFALAQSPAQVDAAIKKGVDALYKSQNANGTWDEHQAKKFEEIDNSFDGTQWGGTTAMAVYALLACGENPNDPRLAKAIQFLHTQPINGTYAVSLKCLVWHQLPDTPEVRKSMSRDFRILMQTVNTKRKKGSPVWDYLGTTRTAYSLSRTQYATLGVWAAGEMGIEAPPAFWTALEGTWEQSQTPEGGWKYMYPGDVSEKLGATTVSMTAAALASLYITQDYTKGEFYAGARGNATSVPIEKGLVWLAQNFKDRVAIDKTIDREPRYAQLYALERVGLASGLRRFGEHDWYAIGATWLIKTQKSNGEWQAGLGAVANTSWALLFLQRGRMPVAFNKLDYTAGVADAKTAIWNQRPRDVANVTRWLSRSIEKELRWQIVAADAKLEALLEAPILYLSGDKPITFTPEAKQLIKSYIEHGGLVVANADVSKDVFTRSVMSLGSELFPAYEWRELPDDHVIWTNQNYKRATMKGRVSVKGLSNGVRELMLVLPTGDPARAWQLRNPSQRTEAWETAANFLSYVTDKTMFYPRGASWLAAEPTTKPQKTVTVAQLKYKGNWNPEPEALNQLSRYAADKKALGIKPQVIDAGQAVDKSVDLLLVSGTVAFEFDDVTRKSIQSYIDAGGTVFFENAGGQGGFATSAEAELAKIVGGVALKRIAAESPIFGKDLKLNYRVYNIGSIANPGGPSVLGVEKDGRIVAMVSREDLSAGWLGVPTDGIVGYAPESARALMTQILSTLKK